MIKTILISSLFCKNPILPRRIFPPYLKFVSKAMEFDFHVGNGNKAT